MPTPASISTRPGRTTTKIGEIVARSRGLGVLADVGAFGGMFRLGAAGAFKDPVLVASTDGIGTKVKVAAALGRFDNLGLDIVNHCLNDIAVQGARPLFFLDYLALHHADPALVTVLVDGVARACAAAGCALLGGETAEMPDVYPPGEFDLAGFVVGVLERGEIGANGEPAAGDVLLGLPSIGLHTNGYSLARRALPLATWSEYDAELGMTVGEALLLPHRSYLPEIQTLLRAGARGFAHITGGGLPENTARPLPEIPGGRNRHLQVGTFADLSPYPETGSDPARRDVSRLQHGHRTRGHSPRGPLGGSLGCGPRGHHHWTSRAARRRRGRAVARDRRMSSEARMGKATVRGPRLAEGKTKIVYADAADPALALIVHKDDITAGDGARRNQLPGKGALSGRTTTNVFRLLRAAGIPTHFVDAPADDEMVVRRCTMIPLEVVMRRLATGSYLKRNAVAEGTRFDPPLVEFFFKDDASHDPLVDRAWIADHNVATDAEIDQLAAIGRQVFETLEAAWAAQNVQLVDLKIEFGRDAKGNLLVADVIDNDSWRIWPGGRKEAMLDKQVYRDTTEVTDEALREVLAKYKQVAALTDAFANAAPLAGASAGEDKPREACGVFGIWGEGTDVARTTLIGLMALQHRGQESAGVAVLDDRRVRVALGMGRVDQIFRPEEVETLHGVAAIGHTRYSTTGSSRIENAQPILVEAHGEAVALAHNGNVVNSLELRRLVRERGVEPTTGSDSELLALLILHGQGGWEERIRRMMELASGAYSLDDLDQRRALRGAGPVWAATTLPRLARRPLDGGLRELRARHRRRRVGARRSAGRDSAPGRSGPALRPHAESTTAGALRL